MLRTLAPLFRAALTALVVLGAAACSADRLAAPSRAPSADPLTPVAPAGGDLPAISPTTGPPRPTCPPRGVVW
jgi:hypothetical protein